MQDSIEIIKQKSVEKYGGYGYAAGYFASIARSLLADMRKDKEAYAYWVKALANHAENI